MQITLNIIKNIKMISLMLYKKLDILILEYEMKVYIYTLSYLYITNKSIGRAISPSQDLVSW